LRKSIDFISCVKSQWRGFFGIDFKMGIGFGLVGFLGIDFLIFGVKTPSYDTDMLPKVSNNKNKTLMKKIQNNQKCIPVYGL
jgi:hypothetical protein